MRYLFLILLISITLVADRGLQFKKMAQEQRLALVIGNNTYKSLPNLKNPIHDARAVRDALKERNFHVFYLENATQRQIDKEVRKFSTRLRNGGVGLFYYAGHGVGVDGKNYLIPLHATNLSRATLPKKLVSLDELKEAVSNSKGFGVVSVRGRILSPLPAQSIIAFIVNLLKVYKALLFHHIF